MFVETADRNPGLLHHIGNADAFEAKFAKPFGSNFHNPSVRLRLVTLRITHLPSPSLPESALMAPYKEEPLEYSHTLQRLDANRLILMQEAPGVNYKHIQVFGEMRSFEMLRNDFIKYFATSGLCSYSSVVGGGIDAVPSKGEAMSKSSPERN